jgi:hypothetical protein
MNSKQSKPIDKQCQHPSQCANDAVIGVYRWNHGQTIVNLDKPVRVFCGQHKPRWTSPNQMHRNVRIVRS